MDEVIRAEVGILGAGPAGMAAALELSALGVSVVILDEGPRPGGQIFRQAPAGYRIRERRGLVAPSHDKGHRLLEDLEHSGVEVVNEATVWDAAPGRLWFEHGGRSRLLRCEHVILATGAYDRLVPFPGWTLPGVITAGGAQVMVRGYMVQPGTRAVVAGTGPLLLPTVTSLLTAGVEVVAALEANHRWRAARALVGVLSNGARLREALHYAAALGRHGVRLRMGWTVFAAHGPDRVESVEIGKVDRRGRPRRQTVRRLDADLVCTGFGLLPSVELALLLGCEMRHDERRGGWIPRTDEEQRTSVLGVFAAGEAAGIGGAEVAMAEGTVAALSIARVLQRGPAQDRDARQRQWSRRRDRERSAADAMLGAFPVLPGLFDLADADTVVCRCEDVTLGAVRQTAEMSGCDLRPVKMGTRAGMGPCQGRICTPILQRVIPVGPGHREVPPPPSIQVPVKPVSVDTVLSAPLAPEVT